MGDKETMMTSGNLNAFQSPMLTATNYTVWAIRMKVLLNVHKVWDTIDLGATDDDKNNIAIALIYQSIPEATIMQVGNLESAREIWNAIKTHNLGANRVKEARLQTLMNEFDGMRMKETKTIDEFVAKLSCTASKAASLVEMIEETKMVKKFLSSLPQRKFVQIVASLEQNLDLKTVGFEDVVGSLKPYEEWFREEDMNSETQGKLMFQRSESSGSRYNDRESTREGLGRGGGRGRGDRGSGQNCSHQEKAMNRENREHKGKTRDLAKVQCYRCDEFGHFVHKCPNRKQNVQGEAKLTEASETRDPSLFMMQSVQETVFLNENKVMHGNYESKDGDEWYLDNGASNHMTSNRSFFSELNNRVTGKVKFGDDSYVDINGKGSILFDAKSGEQRLLTGVYFIPSLRSNISLGQASERGCDIHIKDNYLTMHDGQGRLLMMVTRSPNRLYRIQLKIGKPVSLLSRIKETSCLWHARLGHLNFELIKLMARREMVERMRGLTHENTLCESCLVGKQTRQSFPISAEFRATWALELVHGDLCGPISPQTIVGNRLKLRRLKLSRSLRNWLKEKIKTFHTDRGGEFTSHEFNQFSDMEGIRRHLTTPYTPQQNGVVERWNRTLLDMTRSMLKAMGVLNYLWDSGHTLEEARRSFEEFSAYRSQDRVQAYRLFDLNTQKVVIARDVVFDEKKMWVWFNSGQTNEETELASGLFWVDWNGVIDTRVGQVITEPRGSNSISDENSALSPNSTTASIANLDSPSALLATDFDTLVTNSATQQPL
ncbi:uncharacterized protein LOC143531940 [Bidens hawaiensis]|uniref:uncharacterized protein LOC143531940 n=1 Tax=Bidens hawaiensis TaxID=980011 RepID=UPI00404AB3A6